MSIPTSGTYTLSVVQLKNSTNSDNKIHYNTNNNSFKNSIPITFDGNTIKYGDPVISISYDASSVLEKVYLADGVNALVVKDSNTGISYYITTNPKLTSGSEITYTSSTNTYNFGTATLNQSGTASNKGTNIFQNSIVPCFLTGVEISTPDGFVCIEDLTVGDAVLTFNDGVTSKIDTVTWIGKSHAYVKQSLTDDEMNYPVRVMKNAIADGIPFKDLLITPEHCLFFEGKFIPVRMLVNGSSIIYDKSYTSYDYYHIETNNHSVINADGMLTESYLDTGNRNNFQQEGKIFTLSNNNPKNWETDAAAHLTVCRHLVEPIYRLIESRAKELQFPNIAETLPVTMESNIRLEINNGQIIKPLHQTDNRAVFLLPEHTESVNILSNASRSCDVIGPYVDDRRWLGVLIGKITLHTLHSLIDIKVHLEDSSITGWNNIESVPMRWTSGKSHLPLKVNEQNKNKKSVITLEIIDAGPYLIQNLMQEKELCIL